MWEVSKVPNTDRLIQEIKAMSKMSKIDQIHLRAVMLCMSKMSKIDQIHLRTVMLCMSKMSKIGTYTHILNTVYIKACRRCQR